MKISNTFMSGLLIEKFHRLQHSVRNGHKWANIAICFHFIIAIWVEIGWRKSVNTILLQPWNRVLEKETNKGWSKY